MWETYLPSFRVRSPPNRPQGPRRKPVEAPQRERRSYDIDDP